MVASLHLFALLCTTLSSSLASPLHAFKPPAGLQDLACRLPLFNDALCSPRRDSLSSVQTVLGTATGVQDNGATRFAVKYASAKRWQQSTIQSVWQLPNDASNPATLPLPCPQDGLDDSAMSEDCLSMILYVPNSVNVGSNVPALVWIHGGSYIVGSATGPGLDGSNLAVATNSIVAVIQYRLGGLGFMAPSGLTNLAVNDVVVALKFLQLILPSFGADSGAVTISGQSSGADMARALLAADSVSSLFRSAILQSDPMDIGFLSPGTQKTLQNYFDEAISCASSDTKCLDALSVDQIVNATMDLFSNAASLDPSAGSAQPIRPVHDGVLITQTLDSSTPFPKVSKSLLLSTVRNEAGTTIYGNFPTPVSASLYDQIVQSSFGDPRAGVILNSTFYSVPADTIDARGTLEVLGTDSNWKCAVWTFARSWVANGGTAYVGVYTLGASYPGNSDVSFCTESGVVCHQDDIEIVFGTVINPSSAQSKLIKEVQARYKAFLHSGDPNCSGVSKWPAATSNNTNAILLGSTGSAPVGACVPTFWGEAVEFDYQVFGI